PHSTASLSHERVDREAADFCVPRGNGVAVGECLRGRGRHDDVRRKHHVLCGRHDRPRRYCAPERRRGRHRRCHRQWNAPVEPDGGPDDQQHDLRHRYALAHEHRHAQPERCDVSGEH
ncbi:MAG: hypothetical protein ACK55I_16640, partial [bacterium]